MAGVLRPAPPDPEPAAGRHRHPQLRPARRGEQRHRHGGVRPRGLAGQRRAWRLPHRPAPHPQAGRRTHPQRRADAVRRPRLVRHAGRLPLHAGRLARLRLRPPHEGHGSGAEEETPLEAGRLQGQQPRDARRRTHLVAYRLRPARRRHRPRQVQRRQLQRTPRLAAGRHHHGRPPRPPLFHRGQERQERPVPPARRAARSLAQRRAGRVRPHRRRDAHLQEAGGRRGQGRQGQEVARPAHRPDRHGRRRLRA